MGFFLNPLFPSKDGSDGPHRIKALPHNTEDASNCGLLSHSVLTSTLSWDQSCCYQLYACGHSVLDLTACIHSETCYLLHPEYSSLLFKGQLDHPLISELCQSLTAQWSVSFHIDQNTLHMGSYPGTLCWGSLRLSISNESANIRLVPHQEHPCLMTHNT